MSRLRARGVRQARRARLRRQRRVLLAGGVLLSSVVLAFALRPSPEPPVVAGPQATPDPEPTAAAVAARGDQRTMVLVRDAGQDGPAMSVTVLAAGPSTGDGLVLFVPVATLLDIPGFGVDELGQAFAYGGAPLVEASLENLLGVELDAAASVSDSALAAFLERTGGVELDVERQLVAQGSGTDGGVRFEPGLQFLDGKRMAEYWSLRAPQERELATFPRQQQIWEAVLAAAADRDILSALVADGAPQLSTAAEPMFVRQIFRSLVRAAGRDGVAYSVLPVAPFGDGDGEGPSYRPVTADIDELVARRLEASVPAGGDGEAVRVQVLNGVGTPGIGQAVDRRLEGGAFRIVASDNARNFEFSETQILVYDSGEASLAAAERVRQQLGVGTILLSRQPQSVVDLTIVVGADFRPDDATAAEPSLQEQGT